MSLNLGKLIAFFEMRESLVRIWSVLLMWLLASSSSSYFFKNMRFVQDVVASDISLLSFQVSTDSLVEAYLDDRISTKILCLKASSWYCICLLKMYWLTLQRIMIKFCDFFNHVICTKAIAFFLVFFPAFLKWDIDRNLCRSTCLNKFWKIRWLCHETAFSGRNQPGRTDIFLSQCGELDRFPS